MLPRRNPRHFVRFITSDQTCLKIPKTFIEDNRKQILLNPVLLIVSDDKVWPVGWTVTGDGKVWLQKGWLEFSEYYYLKFGHLLRFKHVGKSIFHVKIFNPRYEQVFEYQPDNRCFSVTVRDSYLQSSWLYVPVNFCRTYLTGYHQDEVRCVLETSHGGRWGEVDCRVFKSFGKLCGQNWKKFSYENSLGAGDVCEFELINAAERVMKVTISRA
ncbi:B3 domain-containing protein REM5-like [Bidens hawaiensis]|uniref:B3 domain-containing protein REM5-like n=1 Tax=Bidens hawaiensis TaxID=980011 RepID=UPI00404A3B89